MRPVHADCSRLRRRVVDGTAATQQGPQHNPQPPQPAYGTSQPGYGGPQPGFANSPGGGGGGGGAGSALDAQRREVKARCVESVTAQCKTLASEMNQFMTMQSKLTDGEAQIAEQFIRMDSHVKQVDAALQWTRKATAEVDVWIQECVTVSSASERELHVTFALRAGRRASRSSYRQLTWTRWCCP